ncbi:flagellar assembly protein FliH [Hydrogenophaga taeniospiralis CCUG 15921]|uniref:Flagellar assembly protein FliH n=2 Tax=Hydrogenophaga TaxID=47420 RepID=A0A9X4P8S6_9BURK|nr:flagellar assembly protein FliH [Hydrogenophaga taeniospiralis CCUG 15921]
MDGSDEAAAPQIEADGHHIDGPVQQALNEVREQAYAEGFAHGHDAGSQEVRDALEATVRKTAEETAVRMAQLLHTTKEQLTRSEEQISRHILELACDLARQVVRQELQVNTQHLRPVIHEALSQLVDDGLPATVRMNPGDLALMKGALQEALSGPRPEFVADASISPGGCLVESPSTSVDATIEKRWMRAVGNLGLDTPWNPENADV